MPKPEVQRCTFLMMLGVMVASIATAQQSSAPRPLVTQYCTSCHSQRAKMAGISLEGLDPANPGENAAIWEKVLRKVNAGQMPPAGMPHPSPAASAAFTKALAE